MRKIITKLSASIILILMLFSTSFNLISYAVDNTQQMEITSGRFRLIVSKEIYDQYEGFLTTWLARYDNYYSILVNYTGQDPISRGLVGSDKIIIDTCNRNLSSAGREAETTGTSSGISIYYCNTRFDKLVETMNVDSATESAALIHELGHVFQYGSNPNTDSYEWCFEIETMAMVCANHIFENSSINRVVKVEPFGINVRPFTSVQSELSSAYTNTSYSNYAKSALKLIQIEHQVQLGSMSSVIRALNTKEDYVFGNNANRFNEFIDTWEQQTGADIWGKFSDEDLETISSAVGGKVGSSEDPEDSILEITSFTADQQDDKIKVNVTIRTNKEPSEVTTAISVNGQEINLNGTKNGETISYTKDIELTKELKDKKQFEISLYVEEQEGETLTDSIDFKVEDEEKDMLKSITAGGDKSGNGKVKVSEDTAINLHLSVKNTNMYNYSISIDGKLVDDNITISGKTEYDHKIDIREIKSILKDKKQATISVSITDENDENVGEAKTTITVINEEGEAQISEIIFIQEGNSNTNEYDCKKESKKGTVSIKIEGIGEDQVKSIQIRQMDGFNQITKSNAPIDRGPINQEGTGRQYDIEIEYTELKKEDLIDPEDPSVLCSPIVVLKDGTKIQHSGIDIYVKNLEGDNFEYEVYYQVGINKEQKIEIGSTVNVDLTEGEQLKTLIKGDTTDSSKYEFKYNKTTFTHQKLTDDNSYTVYPISVKADAVEGEKTLKISVNGKLIVTYIVNYTKKPDDTPITEKEPSAGKEKKGKIVQAPAALFVYNKDGSGTILDITGSNYKQAQTDRLEPNKADTGGEKNWIITDGENQYLCDDHSKGLKFSSGTYFYKYDKIGKKSFDEKEQLVLAFIEHVSDEEATKINGGSLPKNWRENAKQYYVWKNPNDGSLSKFFETIKASKNDYIDYDNHTLTLKNDKGELKTWKILQFEATQYNVKEKYYASTGRAAWVNGEDGTKYMQPLMTYSSTLEEDGTSIRIIVKKTDEDGNALPGAEFALYKEYKDKDGNTKYSLVTDGKRKSDEAIDGYIEKPYELEVDSTYILREETAPTYNGVTYQVSNQYAKITTDKEGKVTWELWDDNGTQSSTKDDTKVSDDVPDQWVEETDLTTTWEEVENIDLDLILILQDKPQNIIKLKKVDKSGIPLPDAKLEVFKIVDGKEEKLKPTYTTDGNGNVEIVLEDKNITYRIKEKDAPDGYALTHEYAEITIDNNGNIPEDGIKFYDKDGKDITDTTELWSWRYEISLEKQIILNLVNEPTIKIIPKKINYKEEGLKGATFNLYEIKSKLDQSMVSSSGVQGAIRTIEGGLGEKAYGLVKGKTYIIKEVQAPQGYGKTENYGIIEVSEEGEITFTAYDKYGNVLSKDIDWEYKKEEGTNQNGIKYEGIIQLKDKPTTQIQIKKVDEAGNPITSDIATFEVSGAGTLITSNNGESNKVALDTKDKDTITITESDQPDGYKKIEDNIVLKLQKNGEKVTGVNVQEGSKYATVEFNSEQDLIVVTIKNEKDKIPKYKYKLKILKVDATTNEPLPNVGFSITGYISCDETTDGSGTIGPLEGPEMDGDTAQEYYITIQETSVPKDYSPIEEPIVIKIQAKEDGTVSKPELITSVGGVKMDLEKIENTEDDLDENTEEQTILINLTIKNSKKIEDTKMPLLMYIKGKVWLDQFAGKNSVADGLHSTNYDKFLYKSIVTICEKGSNNQANIAKSSDIEKAIKNITVPDEVKEHIEKLKEQEEKFGENAAVIETDDLGNFEFYGLDPSKEYTIKFTYNGMRFDECKVSTTAGLSGLNIEQENASRAIENTQQRQNIIDTFSHIGTYPYNYRSESKGGWNKAYNQDQVPEVITLELYKNDYAELKELAKKAKEEDMYYFIKDTLIEATIDTESILKYAENIIKAQNDSIDDKYGKFVYPEVQRIGLPNPHSDDGLYDSFEQAKSAYEKYINEETGEQKSVGWRITTYNQYDIKETFQARSCGICGTTPIIGPYSVGEQRVAFKYDEEYKEEPHSKSLGDPNTSEGCDTHPHEQMTTETKLVGHDAKGNPIYKEVPKLVIIYGKDNIISQSAQYLYSRYGLEVYEIVDGYYTTNESQIRFANFNMDLEPYYNTLKVETDARGNRGIYDEYTNKYYAGKTGLYETDWGWTENGVSALKVAKDLAKYVDYLNRDKITELKDWSEIEKILDEKLTEDEVKDILKQRFLEYENLGVLYRPTVDLGLYNDVLKAYLKTGTAQKEETYVYDKRASNGGAFKFGVNEYDINRPTDVETAYAQYYSNLSNGKTTDNSSQQASFEYTDQRQKEDVFPDAQQESNGIGEAIASGFDPCPVTIELTYKIRVVNQAETEAMATEVVDYFDSAFEFVGAYEDPELTRKISTSDTSIYQSRGSKAAAPTGYQTKYIQLNKWLKNNESTYIYIKVNMVNPRVTLNGYLEPGGEGYKTLNYAEINGYMTHIGVIDIDSMPGNIVDDGKGRFPNGQYEDDEGKSPTYIIRNPGNKTRIIEGNLFEDLTGKDDVKAYIEETRKGDGLLSNDTPISGGVVELVELDDNGNEVKNSKGSEIRGAPLTDSNGHYIIKNIPAGNYLVRFRYGSNNETVLLKNYNGGNNNKSYNGQDYESTLTEYKYASGNKYWYVDGIEGQRWSDAIDNQQRRNEVNEKSKTLTNHIAEVFNSYKDKQPNRDLVEELEKEYQMFAQTALMSIEIENIMKYHNKEVEDAGNKTVADYEYDVKNIDFGIVERERAELQITKKVAYISIVDSTGKEITGGTVEDIQAGKVNYIKMLPNEYDKYGNVDKKGFADMEIDKELLSGALLKIKYEMTVTNTSETSEDDRNPNTITDIQIIDYVSNNLTYNDKYAENRNSKWTPKTVDDITPYLNSTSITTEDETNKIHLKEYQTILQTSIDSLAPGEKETKMLVLEKNLSSEEDSNFNYENQVEIVQSQNEKGRGDYSSIYGNLDPLTYTSRQGNLKWDEITDRKQNAEHGFAQKLTTDADDIRANSIREAEKDSGNAEEVIITPPTGTKGIVFQTQHYIIAIIGLISIAGIALLMKKNLKK